MIDTKDEFEEINEKIETLDNKIDNLIKELKKKQREPDYDLLEALRWL